MKNFPLLASCAALLTVLTAGCGNLDFAAPGDPNRVVVGTVSFSQTIPDNAEVVVRVMDPHPEPLSATGSSLTPPGQMPLLNQPVTATAAAAAAMGPQELGEQVIEHPTLVPVLQPNGTWAKGVPYRVEYRADDDLMRRGVSIEVRISYGGRVQLINSNQYSETLSDVKDAKAMMDPHPIEADSIH
jgi:hypothetical protein